MAAVGSDAVVEEEDDERVSTEVRGILVPWRFSGTSNPINTRSRVWILQREAVEVDEEEDEEDLEEEAGA